MNTVWSWQFNTPRFVDLFCPFLLTLEVKSDPMTHPPPPIFPVKKGSGRKHPEYFLSAVQGDLCSHDHPV